MTKLMVAVAVATALSMAEAAAPLANERAGAWHIVH
jgi:hypothetical protein